MALGASFNIFAIKFHILNVTNKMTLEQISLYEHWRCFISSQRVWNDIKIIGTIWIIYFIYVEESSPN